jgi:hypothetical protein
MTATMLCSVCNAGRVDTVLDLGAQPVSSHFTEHPGETVIERPLRLAVCGNCGVVQLEAPFPFRDLVPPYDWITYREPEGHLDATVDKVGGLPGIDARSQVVGLSFKDRTTLERLGRKGFQDIRLLDPYVDLGANYPNANIESIPGLMTPEIAGALAHARGPADVVIARHVVEHAESFGGFLAALAELVKPEGYLILEVPECSGNLLRQDYTMLWEEHAYYFNARTIRHGVVSIGFSVVALDVWHYPFEDIAVVYAKKTKTAAASLDRAEVARDVATARAFGAAFATWTTQYDDLCSRLTAGGRKLAAYGAGHLTCAFLGFHGLARHFAFVVDDTRQKQKLFMPKSGLPVVGRERLAAEQIAACLFGLGPETENKIIPNNQDYLDRGGAFHSMLADSPRSIRNLL